MNRNTPDFEKLYSEYRPLVLRIARGILGNPHDAEDAAQEAFTKVWRGIDEFNHEASLKTWIYRITVNTCLDHSRKAWRRFDAADTTVDDAVRQLEESVGVSNHDTAERRLLVKEHNALIRRAVSCLRPHLKAVFVMKEIEELSYEEISSRLGLSMGTISSRLNRARKALQEAFGNFAPALARG